VTESLVLAEVLGAHGIKGGVKVRPLLEEPTFLVGLQSLALAPGSKMRPGASRDVKVISLRPQGRGWVAQLSGVEDRTSAEGLKGMELLGPASLLPALEDGDFYWRDLEGLRVWCESAEGLCLLGEIDHLLETGANDVLVVRPCEGSMDDTERLIPWLVDDVIREVDMQSGTVRVKWYTDV
jgi:16S rRNA processing protein RimM